jgi:UDP-N-acetylmuramoylalanine--D-glutamate ligase
MNPIIEEFINKNICIWGWGREGQSTYSFINKFLPNANITIADKNKIKEKSLKYISETELIEKIDLFDLIIKSPGISLYNFNIKKSDKLTSQVELFLKHYKHKTIGVTGTKGKSTTTSLIYHLLRSINIDAKIGGNMGIPVFELLINDADADWYVIELSCHQLDQIKLSPHISILYIFPEHLDYYKSFELYKEAKLNILSHQNIHDIAIINNSMREIQMINSEIWQFGNYDINENRGLFYQTKNNFIFKNKNFNKKLIIHEDKLQLKGKHNLLNISAALLASYLLSNFDIDKLIDYLYDFQPLPHRLEYVGKYQNIDFYNDSISTIPQSTIAALESLGNVDTLILGGMDRGIDYTELIDYLKKSKVRNIFCIGELKIFLYNNLKENQDKNIMIFDSLEQAIDAAYKYTLPDKICLLSPAAPSYDQFKNFEDRGDKFKTFVKIKGK